MRVSECGVFRGGGGESVALGCVEGKEKEELREEYGWLGFAGDG